MSRDATHGQNPERRQTTSQQRTNWGPECSAGAYKRVDLHGEGRVTVDKRCVPAVEALSAVLERHGYETRRADTGAYSCRPITGGTGYSLHAYGIAVDINWTTNPYGKTLVTDMPRAMVDDILAITTVSGARVWEWGGDWAGNKDAMHFELDCTPADLATGLRATTKPAKPAPPREDPLMPLTDAQAQGLVDDAKTAAMAATSAAQQAKHLVDELIAPVNTTTGDTRADRMAKVPGAVADVASRLARIEAHLGIKA